jgi:neutral ceramidase
MGDLVRHFAAFTVFAAVWIASPGVPAVADEPSHWQAGFARVVITPDEPMWLSGYGSRTKPAEGKLHDLFARAATFRDAAGTTAVLVSTDLVGLSPEMADTVCDAVAKRHGLQRSAIMLTCSHTHCGPALDQKLSHMLAMDGDDWKQVKAYQQVLNAKLIDVIGRAIADLQPARVSLGRGSCGFAANRRPPIGTGPYDHDVPVLRVASADGANLRGVVFGYACHSTTLSLDQWLGDYPGFAALNLEERHPNAVALFFAGCGADQNPLPRRRIEWAERYGRMLSLAVEDVLRTEMRPVHGELDMAFATIDLKFASVPTREEIEKNATNESRFVRARAALQREELDRTGTIAPTYAYPIQVWRFGDDLTWVALGGEVVVDYSLRLKRELGRGGTWVTAYANDVMGYIPSERILAEGGYEGETSMLYYQLPSKWAPGLEEQIITKVLELAGQGGNR